MSAANIVRPASVAAGLAGLAVHAVPAITSIEALRRRVFPALAGTGAGPTVAVTFDDGPDPDTTPRFLELLRELGWRATFFMLGSMVRRAPALAAEVAAAGHAVGLHGDEHRNLLFRGPAGTWRDLRRGRDSIGEVLGEAPQWFRPPYGVLTGGAALGAGRLGMRTVLWTDWGRDWRPQATPESIVADVRRGLRPGGTVLLHDTSTSGSWRATLGALAPLDALIRAVGAVPVRLDEHFRADDGSTGRTGPPTGRR